MKHKRLAQWSIGFVVLIFLSQTYLIYRLFQVNYTFLEKVVNTITQDVYTKDMNFRLGSKSANVQPRVAVFDNRAMNVDTTKAYNIDAMKGVDKSSMVSILNIVMEMYLTDKNPIKLHSIDSLATILLEKENIHTAFYTRIVDLKKDSVLECSKPDISISPSSWFSIQSKNIPLNFTQDKVLQLVLLNPLNVVFTQMAGMLFLSLLLSLFCIYCLYSLQITLSRQKKLAQTKNDFYNQVSHELKRPVSVVFQAIDSLLNTKAMDSVERRSRYLELSMTELQRMNSKVDMILTMSMMEDGMFQLNKSDFNLLDLLEELKERYFIPGAKPIELIIENKMVNPMVCADREHLSQCISNLTDNAVKYSGDRVQIIFRLFEEDGSFCISVRDNGQGIQEKDFQRIFQKFERASSDKKSHGYGIGLSYVKQIVEMHGGTISVGSEWGKWSDFVIRIPQAH
jgi:two-component system, OmpR family, phosphate regulon sensor histidine kinase PhoR